MRLGCLPPLISIALLIGGGQGLYTAFTNRAPKVFTIEQYLKSKHSDKWLRLTGGVVRVVEASSKRILGGGRATEVFVPVRPEKQTSKDPITVLLATRDPDTLHLVDGMHKLSENDQIAFALAHERELFAHRDVEGLVRFGIESKDRDERKLRQLYQNLAPDFVVLEEGKKPDLTQALFLFVGGLALAGWLLMRAVRPPPPVPIANWPPPSSPPPPPPPPLPRPPGDPPLRQG